LNRQFNLFFSRDNCITPFRSSVPPPNGSLRWNPPCPSLRQRKIQSCSSLGGFLWNYLENSWASCFVLRRQRPKMNISISGSSNLRTESGHSLPADTGGTVASLVCLLGTTAEYSPTCHHVVCSIELSSPSSLPVLVLGNGATRTHPSVFSDLDLSRTTQQDLRGIMGGSSVPE
jgi:hypothetical protein